MKGKIWGLWLWRIRRWIRLGLVQKLQLGLLLLLLLLKLLLLLLLLKVLLLLLLLKVLLLLVIRLGSQDRGDRQG